MRVAALLLPLLFICRAPNAAAQPATPPASSQAAPATPTLSLKARFGPQAAERLLKNSDVEVRLRALDRLSAHGSDRAIEVLVQALDPGGAARSPRERLVATRALAAHARRPNVRQALLRVMSGTAPGQSEPGDALGNWVRATAALALSASGDNAGLAALGSALRQGGAMAELAAAALLAHPPRNLEPILRSRGAATPALVETLGQLGDQRGFALLRNAVRGGSPELAAAAAIALTRLGDLETVELARHWTRTKRDPALLLGAARILAMTRAPDRSQAIQRALGSPETHAQALELALADPESRLVDALIAELRGADGELRGRCLAALGRSGDARAIRVLQAELAGPRAAAAAYALALAESPLAARALELGLADPRQRRHALRALVIRELSLGEPARGTRSVIASLLGSSDHRERAAAAWALSAVDPARGASLIQSRDPAVLHAAARAGTEPTLAAAAIRRLSVEQEPKARAALSIALAVPGMDDGLTTALLIDLLEHVPPAAPLAARGLAARAAPELYARIEALLANSDIWLRSHVAQGLGRARDPRALGWLVSAYRFETSVEVRRAIASALSLRGRGSERSTLTIMASLDPDPAVRTAARAGLAGRAVELSERGHAAAWIELVGATPDGADVGAMLLAPSGTALPMLPDPDGALTIVGLPPGPIGVRLAAVPKRSQAARSGPAEE